MDRGLALALLKTQEAALKAKGVAHLYLFGSVSRNEGDKASDVDVAFDLQPDIEFDAFDMGGVMLGSGRLARTEGRSGRTQILLARVREDHRLRPNPDFLEASHIRLPAKLDVDHAGRDITGSRHKPPHRETDSAAPTAANTAVQSRSNLKNRHSVFCR